MSSQFAQAWSRLCNTPGTEHKACQVAPEVLALRPDTWQANASPALDLNYSYFETVLAFFEKTGCLAKSVTPLM
jgi:hypothetical protein